MKLFIKIQKSLAAIFLVLFLLTIIVCAPVTKQMIKFSLTLNKEASSTEEKDNLIIRVKPILRDNFKLFPKVFTKSVYGFVPERIDIPTKDLILFNLPAFELTITNNTGHVIKFNRVVSKLQDDTGETYDIMLKSDIMDAIDNYSQMWVSKGGGKMLNPAPLKAKAKSLKIIDNNFELLPGFTSKGYLVFNFGYDFLTKSNFDMYYENFLSSKEYLKVLLFEIPVEMDEAGITKKTTNFTFIYNVKAETITVN